MKIGDKVRILSTPYGSTKLAVGVVGTVVNANTKFYGHPGAEIVVDNCPYPMYGEGWNFPVTSLEVIE